MKIAVLGTGNVGGTLGRRWAQHGRTVVFGTRDQQSEKVRALLAEAGENASATSVGEAVAEGDVVVLASPWAAAKEIVEAIGDWNGKIIIDCINPLNAEFSGLDLGYDISAAERVAAWAPRARVVKAFNTVSARVMANPDFDGRKATLFYCGDDEQAKAVVDELAADLGFDPVDAGPLRIARYLEPLAMLYIHLAVFEGWGSNCAFSIMKR